jgi:hypothetical protein
MISKDYQKAGDVFKKCNFDSSKTLKCGLPIWPFSWLILIFTSKIFISGILP